MGCLNTWRTVIELMTASGGANREISAAKITGYNTQSEQVSLVLIHGVYHGAWSFQHMVPQLTALGYPVYTVDLRGHTGVDRIKPSDTIGYADYLEDVTRLLKEIPGDKCVIGHSLGGLLALSCAHLNEVKQLVLLATPLPEVLKKKRWSLLFKYPFRSLQMIFHRDAAYFYHDAMFAKHFFFTDTTPETLFGQCLQEIRRQNEPFRLFEDLNVLSFRDLNVTLPTLIIYGELDPIVDEFAASKICQIMPGELHCIQGAGHDFMVEPNYATAVAERIHCHLCA